MINCKYFYNLSVTIIGIVTSVFLLTTVGGLFHIPVNTFYVLIPFAGGLYYLKKQSPENIDFLKQFLILLIIVFVSYILAISVWDSSSDGRWYHAATLIMYKNGWLPVYQNYHDFAAACNVHPSSAFWGNCYLHFAEIIGANIYKITNLIESTKTTNFIILSAVFFYSYSVLSIFKSKNKFLPFLCSLIIILNPVVICQWFTNFIDLHIYFAFTLIVLTIIKTELQKTADKTDLFMFVCSALMLAMTKLTGCMYLFLICSIYMIYLFILKRNIRKYIKTVLVIGGLIAVTGVNPFFTNLRDYGNPFYPIFGKNNIEIINNIPLNFEKMPAAERFFRSTFSESLHSMNNTDIQEYIRPAELKIPFTVNIKSSANLFCYSDMRIGGFGYFWSGILFLSLIFLPFIRFRNSNEKYLFLLITSIILLTTFSNPHCWWARFIPQFWLFPLFIIFFGLLQKNYKNNFSAVFKLFLLYATVFSFIINSGIIIFQNTDFNISISNMLKKPYKYTDFNKKPRKILLMVKPDNKKSSDETIIPHLEEFYGKENIIFVSYEENKINSENFIPIQYIYVLNEPYYFFKEVINY